MILDGVCNSAIHFGRIILSRTVEPSRSQSSKAFFCLLLTCTLGVLTSLVLIQHVISLKTFNLPSGESALKH